MKLERELSKITLVQEIDDLRSQADALRPFSSEAEGRIMQKFRLDWNYHSNAIEGNPYSYGETVAFLMHGITAKGKKLKDHLDIKGHDEAIKYLLELIKGDRIFSENDIRELHEMILKEPYEVDAITPDGQPTKKLITLGDYKATPNHVKTATGEMHFYATPEETPAKMTDLVNWLDQASKEKEIHPLILAALFHHKFVEIHPFDDGNGRLGRILMNFILMKKGFPPIVIKMQNRDIYYAVLSQADVGEYLPLVEYLGEGLKHSLEIQLKGAKGEDISELADLDKEIALLKGKFGEELLLSKKSRKSLLDISEHSILPLMRDLISKCKEFDEFFFHNSLEIEYFKLAANPAHAISFSKEDSLEKTLSIIDRNEDLFAFSLKYKLEEFRKENSSFSLELSVTVYFEDYHYVINKGRSDGLRIIKQYHEQIEKAERQVFVFQIIKKDILDEINSRTIN